MDGFGIPFSQSWNGSFLGDIAFEAEILQEMELSTLTYGKAIHGGTEPIAVRRLIECIQRTGALIWQRVPLKESGQPSGRMRESL